MLVATKYMETTVCHKPQKQMLEVTAFIVYNNTIMLVYIQLIRCIVWE